MCKLTWLLAGMVLASAVWLGTASMTDMRYNKNGEEPSVIRGVNLPADIQDWILKRPDKGLLVAGWIVYRQEIEKLRTRSNKHTLALKTIAQEMPAVATMFADAGLVPADFVALPDVTALDYFYAITNEYGGLTE